MAEFRIVVTVDASAAKAGLVKVERGLDRVNRRADRLRSTFRNLFVFSAIAAGVRELVRLADSFTIIQNRLGTVISSTASLNVVTKELLAVSNRTRASFKGTAEIYARAALSAKTLGVSQQQLINFTESLNQAVVLSGSTVQEANNALIQLSQGLASNTLRGDELRSVLEQLPVVADVIAKSIGATRGQLRELGREGKISAGTVLQAFKEAREELAERFAKTVPTIAQSMQVLNNQFTFLLGQFNKSTGVAGAVSRAILFVAENLEVLGRAAIAAGIAIGVVFGVKGIGLAIRGLQALAVAIALNPFTAIASAALIAVSALTAFSDKIKLTADGTVLLSDGLTVAAELIGDTIVDAVNALGGEFENLPALLLKGVEFMAKGLIKLIAVGGGVVNALKASFKDFVPFLADVAALAFNGFLDAAEASLNDIVGAINVVRNFFGSESLELFDFNALKVEGGTAGASVALAFAEGYQEVLDKVGQRGIANRAAEALAATEEAEARARLDDLFNALDQMEDPAAAKKRAKEAAKRAEIFAKTVRDLEQEAMLLRVVGDERERLALILDTENQLKIELTDTQKTTLENLLAINQALREEDEILNSITNPRDDYEKSLAALNRLLERGAVTTEQFADKQRELRLAFLETQTDFASGAERGIAKIVEQYTDGAAQLESVLTSAFDGATDALTEFVMTGKADFSSLVDSILTDITRMAVKGLVGTAAGALFGQQTGGSSATSFGGGGGGIGGLIGGLFGGGTGGGAGPGAGPGSGGAGGAGFFGSLGSLFAFANGGEFDISGKAGVDQNLLSVNNKPVARVSKGESVSVSPEGGGGKAVIVNYNISTPDVGGFQRSQGQILARTNASLNRAQSRNG